MAPDSPTSDAVLSAVASVVDPLLDHGLVELGLVRDVEIGKRGVRIVVALPQEHPEPEAIRQAVADAAGTVPGIGQVEVDAVPMEPEAEEELAQRLAPSGGAERPNPFESARTRVLAVSSGKGGVGKSSVTANISVSLARQGHRVAAVDADVWGFSLPRMMGVDHPPAVLGKGLLLPPRAYGVKLISMGFFVDEDQPVIWRGPMLHKALNQFITDVYWGELDYLVVDMPPGTGDISLSMAQFLPRAEVVIVTTPQPAAQKVAQRAAAMADKVRLSVVGVVENMSWFRGDDGKAYEIFGRGGGQELADQLDVPLLGQVPLVPELREGGDTGRPITIADPSDEASQVFEAIATRLHGMGPRRIPHPDLKIV